MKVIVPIKQILDPQGILVRRDKERVFINREDYIVDPGSKAALEAALRLKDSGSAEVVALCVGQPRADDALREALAMGCDAAYLLTDSAFAEADIAAVATILAAAVGKLGGADLIIAGCASGDTGSGQVGPRLAGALDYAQVTNVYALAINGSRLQATRRWDGAEHGYAVAEAPLPAVVTVAPEAFRPRYPHGARIMNAYREWEVHTWSASDLELEPASLAARVVFRRESFPPPIEVGEVLRGAPASVAQEVVTALKLQRMLD